MSTHPVGGASLRERRLPEKFSIAAGAPTAEWLVLAECASAHPNAERLGELLREPLDWPVLLALAEEHGVMGLLANRLLKSSSEIVSRDILTKLRERQRAQLVFTLSTCAELFRLLELFSKPGIEALVVKGPVLSARAYSDPGLRQYIDLDLLVRQADIQRATELLMAAGYQSRVPGEAIAAGRIPGEYLFLQPESKMPVELHTEHTFRYYPRPLAMEELFQRKALVCVDTHAVPALSIEDELVMICIHGAKHFWERLMWIADVAAMIERQAELDWERAFAAAREVGAERMLHVGLRLAADQLSAPMPEEIRVAVSSDRGAERLAGQILRRLPEAASGAPGLMQRAIFRMRMRGGIITGPTYFLRLVFLPTEDDWRKGEEGKGFLAFDALRRPFRLARKHRGDGRE